MPNGIGNSNHESAPDGTIGGSASNRKLKGATEVIHGLGENIRGRFMDTLDSSTKTGHGHPETQQGRTEVEQGMAKLTGGPGVLGGAPRSDTHPMRPGDAPYSQPNRASDASTYGSGQLAQEGNTLGPTSAMTAGFGNAGPEMAVAEAPYQQSAGGTGAPGARAVGENQNDRDFGHAKRNEPAATAGQRGNTLGPAPDRYALGGEGPRQLP
ncbi:hypothetical protein L226DRAFT_610016 [Lentinus tigrinus ALCF2SS1-7]|uniref:Uncharacterized protein n=1 Tax=Lentinus tigrinus ALCF2SS1-6 TaxID=1328759 RepID=A0A5C2RZR2_9APHY|nr:hypothetical protein L227DRAFT_578684 [Lentinus tigrinus ALCF2SS1-6]RPD79615.1 hypothetical protein L226DRAFT_610016 [Lentinus tigrinus ALCF2SS1-7]